MSAISVGPEKVLTTAAVLIADSNAFTRRITRTMLINSGVKSTYEVGDGAAALQAIESVTPDVLIMNWDLSLLSGRELLQIIRSPDSFSKPNLPIILLTDLGLSSHISAAVRLGANEILLTPISPHRLQERLLSILLTPRPMVRAGGYYVPLPRRKDDLAELLAEVRS